LPELSLPQKQTRQFWLILTGLSLLWFALVIALQFSLPLTKFQLFFLDVGQGDSALLITPQYQKVVIDGGPDQRVIAEISKLLPFWDRQLDALILSHADQDHIGGLIPLARRYQIRQLYLGITNDINPNLNQLIEIVKTKGGKITLLNQKRDLLFSQPYGLDILSPAASKPTFSKRRNDDSLIFKLLTPYGRVLFTGDISVKTETWLVKNYQNNLSADILKVAHHGSKTSSSAIFLNQVKAKHAIISVAANNNFGHPNPDVLKRLATQSKIHRSDLCATIAVSGLLKYSGQQQQQPEFNFSC